MRALLNGIAALALLAAGCISTYKVEIQQGNVVTQEMIEKLKPGLTKNQVRFVLGTPLITDPFHPQRWDYVYQYKKHASAPAETRQLTVYFEGDTLARVEGDIAQAPLETPRAPTAAGGSDDRPAAPSAPSARLMTPERGASAAGVAP